MTADAMATMVFLLIFLYIAADKPTMTLRPIWFMLFPQIVFIMSLSVYLYVVAIYPWWLALVLVSFLCLSVFASFRSALIFRAKTQGAPDWLLRRSKWAHYLSESEMRIVVCRHAGVVFPIFSNTYISGYVDDAMAYKQKHGTLPPEYLTEPSEA